MVKYSSDSLDLVFRGLADPIRRQIVTDLRAGDRTVGQLHADSSISLVAFLKHVEVLEAAGLVASMKQGRTRICHLRPERLADAEGWLAETRSFWTNALRQLDRHLESDPS